jgi:fused signal recognition particle receptor
MKFFDRFRKNNETAAPPKPETSEAPQVLPESPAAPESSESANTSFIEPVAAASTLPVDNSPVEKASAEKKTGWFTRLKAGLQRTSSNFADGMGNLFLGKKVIDQALMEELETQLLMADVGIDATQRIVGNLSQRVSRKELADSEALYRALQEELRALLAPCSAPLQIDGAHKPYVILMVGVNGVGKTTTIGKLAKRFRDEGRSVLLAAGDTFRAAAVEQLQVWGERNGVPVIAQHSGADSASVIFDGLQAAQARGVDVLIADTAGRLHNKDNLMEELKKIVRVMRKLDASAPHEVMLVLDAGTGQNALAQAQHFQQAVGVSGLVLSKLDGTAKGGIIFAISEQCRLPIRFIGVGEQADDLRPFDADEFIRALFQRES